MNIFRRFLAGINLFVDDYDRQRRWLIFGAPKPTELQKAMKELERNPSQANTQKVAELSRRK